MHTSQLTIERLPGHGADFPELKDPSVIRKPDGSYEMYASVGRSDIQSWKVGRFVADHVAGVWRELHSATLHRLSGPQLCAPAVTYRETNGHCSYKLYIQTACFEENGVICAAESIDGMNFFGHPEPLVTKDTPPKGSVPITGVYDVSLSHVRLDGRLHECLTFTGITRVGHGDVYAMFRDLAEADGEGWTPAHRILAQEEVPFHNRPDGGGHYEWCIEGTQVVELGRSQYLMVGVCFLDKPKEMDGERQRVFFAVSRSPKGPFVPVGTPVEPLDGRGENGHPDTVLDGEDLHLVYQERAGDGQPWHLRHTTFRVDHLRALVDEALGEPAEASFELLPTCTAADIAGHTALPGILPNRALVPLLASA